MSQTSVTRIVYDVIDPFLSSLAIRVTNLSSLPSARTGHNLLVTTKLSTNVTFLGGCALQEDRLWKMEKAEIFSERTDWH